jgi:hypothetical protein
MAGPPPAAPSARSGRFVYDGDRHDIRRRSPCARDSPKAATTPAHLELPGGTVARAKKTDRAEARRRSRAAALEAAGADATTGAPAGSAKATTSTSARVGAPPAARPGIADQFRAAIRPVNVRQDLRDLPWLITRTPAVAVPSLLVLASAIWYGATGGSLRDLPGMAFNLFVFPPPLAALFLAGILTTRMSYLAGGIVGIVSFVVFSVYLFVGPVQSATPLTQAEQAQYVLYALVISPLAGVAIGGFAGFYRRFLRVTNPNRGNKQSGGKNAKASARR